MVTDKHANTEIMQGWSGAGDTGETAGVHLHLRKRSLGTGPWWEGWYMKERRREGGMLEETAAVRWLEAEEPLGTQEKATRVQGGGGRAGLHGGDGDW